MAGATAPEAAKVATPKVDACPEAGEMESYDALTLGLFPNKPRINAQ